MSILEVLQVLDVLNKSANWQDQPFEAEWHTYPPTESPDQKVCDQCLALDGMRYESEGDFDSRPHPNCRCMIHVFTQAGDQLIEYWVEPPPWEG